MRHTAVEYLESGVDAFGASNEVASDLRSRTCCALQQQVECFIRQTARIDTGAADACHAFLCADGSQVPAVTERDTSMSSVTGDTSNEAHAKE